MDDVIVKGILDVRGGILRSRTSRWLFVSLSVKTNSEAPSQ